MKAKFGGALIAAALVSQADAYIGVYQRIGKNFYKTWTQRSSVPWGTAAPITQLVKTNNIDWKMSVETILNEDLGH